MRFENFSSSDDTATVTLLFSLLILINSPRLPVFPFTLIRSCKYFSSCATSMMLSSHGCWQSTQYFVIVFFTSPFFALRNIHDIVLARLLAVHPILRHRLLHESLLRALGALLSALSALRLLDHSHSEEGCRRDRALSQ